jgi:hypothetical protein
VLSAGIERTADDVPAGRLDLVNQWRKLVAMPAAGEYIESLRPRISWRSRRR